MFLFIIGILSYSGSDVINNGPVSPALSEQPVTGERQLNHSESEGVFVNCLSSFNKLQTRFPKEPGVGGLFVVQGEMRYNRSHNNVNMADCIHTERDLAVEYVLL